MTDLYWWLIVVGVIILSVAIHYRIHKSYHYICPKCSTTFKPSFFHSLIAINSGDYRKMRCPACNCNEYMKAYKDKSKHSKQVQYVCILQLEYMYTALSLPQVVLQLPTEYAQQIAGHVWSLSRD